MRMNCFVRTGTRYIVGIHMNMMYNKNRKRRKETEGLKKRIFVLITAVAMLGFVLVGCGSAKKAEKEV